MNGHNSLYQSDLSYDSILYREITERLLAGTEKLVNEGVLPSYYEESFRQGADICRSFLVGAGFNVGMGVYRNAQGEKSVFITDFLDALLQKYASEGYRRYSLAEIDYIARQLSYFATGEARPGNYSQEKLESMHDFFKNLCEIFSKECDESGIYIDPCALITEAPRSIQ